MTTRGFVQNCLIIPRPGDGALFVDVDDTVSAHLDGYAIVPIEVYESLQPEADREAACRRADEARAMRSRSQPVFSTENPPPSESNGVATTDVAGTPEVPSK